MVASDAVEQDSFSGTIEQVSFLSGMEQTKLHLKYFQDKTCESSSST